MSAPRNSFNCLTTEYANNSPTLVLAIVRQHVNATHKTHPNLPPTNPILVAVAVITQSLSFEGGRSYIHYSSCNARLQPQVPEAVQLVTPFASKR